MLECDRGHTAEPGSSPVAGAAEGIGAAGDRGTARGARLAERSSAQVAGGARELLGSVSTQAVYDVLNVCRAADLVRRIEPAGHPARYETRTGDNHHHLVCRTCGRTEDVDCTVGVAPCLTPAESLGFVVDEAEVVFWGLCSDCDHHDRKRMS